MKNVAFVFPGQGAQSVGMGQDLFDAWDVAKSVYRCFDAHTVSDLSRVCFNGPEETLKRTLYTQPAILATSLSALAAFQEKVSIRPVVTAGHSLGEYGALVAAGVMDVEMAAKLIFQRASLMDKAPQGVMSAVLAMSSGAIEAVLADIRNTGVGSVVVANDNTPDQVVISGDAAAVQVANEKLKAAGAKRVIPLAVGGAFHSPLMGEAASAFSTFLTGFSFSSATLPVITNVDALPTTEGSVLREKLGQQIDHSVRWTQTMAVMVDTLAVDTVIEFGPGKVLTGMFKKTHPSVTVYNVSDCISLDSTVLAVSEALMIA